MAHQVGDNDFPIGPSAPRKHPKRVLLKELAKQNAKEYAGADKSSDWTRPDGVTLRSKTKIIDDIIAILMPPDGGGHYKEKKNNEWVVIDNEPDNRNKVRTMVATHLKTAMNTFPPQPELERVDRNDNAHEPTENHHSGDNDGNFPSFPRCNPAYDESNDENPNGQQDAARLVNGSTALLSDDLSRMSMSIALGDGSDASVDFVNRKYLDANTDDASTEKYDVGDALITPEPLGSLSHIDGRAQRQNHDDENNTDVRMVSKPRRERVQNIHGAAPSDMQTVHSVSSSNEPTSVSSMTTSLQTLSISKKELIKAGDTSKPGHLPAGSKALNERMKATLMPPSNDANRTDMLMSTDANAPSNHAKILHEHLSGDKHSRSGSSAVCSTEPQNQRRRCHSAPPSDQSCNLGSHDLHEWNDSVNNFLDMCAPSSTASFSSFWFRSSMHGNKHSGSELSTKSTEQPRKKRRSSFPSGNVNETQWRAKHTAPMVSVMSKLSMGSAVLDTKGAPAQHVPENVTTNSKPPLGCPGYHVSQSVATGKEINISRRGDGVSTVVSGLGYDGGKAADQLLEDLQNPELDESEIATRLDDLLDVAISNNSSSWSNTFQRNVSKVMGNIMKTNLENRRVQLKSFDFLGSYYFSYESVNIPGALVDQLMEVLNSSCHENDEEIQCYGLWLFGVTKQEENVKKFYIDADGIKVGFVIKKCQQFTDNAAIQANGCRALGHLASKNNVNQKAIMEANGIDVILNAMIRCMDHSDVQQWGCYALGQLATDNNVNQDKIMEKKGIHCILIVMSAYKKNSDVQLWGCAALGLLAFKNNVNKKAMMKANGIDVILNAMKQHENHSDVQHWGCLALGHLACDNDVNQEAIMVANDIDVIDVIDVILNAMERHKDHSDVQKCGCYTLGQLAYDIVNQKAKIDIDDIVMAILNAMKKHKDHSEVQQWACCSLGKLAIDVVIQKIIMAANGIEYILNAMSQHKDHSDVQEAGCTALGNLAASNNNVNQEAIVKAKGIEVILNAMKRHEDHSHVQEGGCLALGNLASNNNVNQKAIMEANGIEVILNAMKQYKDHDVQRYGCMALGNLASNNNVNQEAIMEAKGFHVIVNVIKQYKDHSDVYDSGCYALTRLIKKHIWRQMALKSS